MHGRNAIALVSVMVFCCVGIAHSSEGLSLLLSCEPAELCCGDELSVLASGENTGEAIAVDLYLAIVTPSGEFFYLPGGAAAEPRISNLTLPAGSSFSDFELFSGHVQHGLPAGEYQWILAAVPSGTGDDLAYDASSMKLGYDCWETFSALNAVQSLFLQGDSLWLGTLNGGAARYDLTTGEHVKYGMSEGLASSEVNDFCVDGNGNLWAATGYWTFEGDFIVTWGGVSRLNGTTWTSFYPDDEGFDPFLASRRGSRIKALAYSAIDDAVYAVSQGDKLFRIIGNFIQVAGSAQWISSYPDGSVCVLSGGGLYRLAGRTRTDIAEGAYEPVFVASDGSIWCSSEDYGLFRLRDDGSWESIEELEGCHICKILEAQGKLWVLTRYRLFVWDDVAWMSEELPFSNYGRALAVSETGAVYVGFDEGILLYRAGSWDLIALDCPYYVPFPYHLHEGVSDVAFSDCSAFTVRWPCVSRFDGSNWSALPPRHVSEDHYWIWDDVSLFADSEGSPWIYGTTGTKLEVAALKGNQWLGFEVDQTPGSSRYDRMAQDASGALWLYSIGRSYPNDPVYVCDGVRGLRKFDSIKAAVEERYEVICESEPKTDIWLLDPAREVVWVTLGVPDLGYRVQFIPACFDGENWVDYEGTLPGGAQIRVFWTRGFRSPIDIDDQGCIWTLTDLGLCRLDRSDEWYEPSGRADDLGPPLHVDAHGSIWVARRTVNNGGPLDYQGLARYNIDEGVWEDFTERDVPICDWILNIRSAPNGDVWFCTWEGATRYSQGPR